MSLTMRQLHQLSETQLRFMCHRYRVAPRYIEHLCRRQLEHRLHIAIITERANWRAFNLLNSLGDEKYQRDFNAWSMDDNRYDYDTAMSTEAIDNEPRAPYYLSYSQRFSGGFEYKNESEELKHLADYEVDYVKKSSASSQHSDTQMWSMSETKQMMGNLELQQLNQQNSHHSESEQPKLQIANENEAQLKSTESEYNCYWDIPQEPSTDYHSFSSEADISCLCASECAIQKLKRAERFNWITASNHSIFEQSCPEQDASSEHVLCTINYLSKEQLIAMNDESDQLKLQDSDEDSRIGEVQSSKQFDVCQRSSLLRYIYKKVCCNSQGDVDLIKLHFTIICCGLVIISTYVGFKLLQ